MSKNISLIYGVDYANLSSTDKVVENISSFVVQLIKLQIGHGYFEMLKIRGFFCNKVCCLLNLVNSFTKAFNYNIIQMKPQF